MVVPGIPLYLHMRHIQGIFEMVKWLKQQNCPWDSRTFQYAAMIGYIEIMEWLYQNNCPWDAQTYQNAINNDEPAIAKWLRDHGCPIPSFHVPLEN